MKIKKIKTSQDISNFLECLEIGKEFFFQSRGKPVTIVPVDGFYKITDGETFRYTKNATASMISQYWKGGINQALKRIAASGRR